MRPEFHKVSQHWGLHCFYVRARPLTGPAHDFPRDTARFRVQDPSFWKCRRAAACNTFKSSAQDIKQAPWLPNHNLTLTRKTPRRSIFQHFKCSNLLQCYNPRKLKAHASAQRTTSAHYTMLHLKNFKASYARERLNAQELQTVTISEILHTTGATELLNTKKITCTGNTWKTIVLLTPPGVKSSFPTFQYFQI